MELKETDFTSKTIAIRINRLYHEGMTDQELYDATRCFWRVQMPGRANECVYALAVYKGEVKAVYRIHEWLRGDKIEVTTRKKVPSDDSRWGFVGVKVESADDMYRAFVGQSVKALMSHGNQNPIMYLGFDETLK